MLGVRRLMDSHTAANLARGMDEMLQTFDIPKSKIVAVCTDGGANIMAAVRKLLGEGKNVYCFAHLLNLVVTDGLEDQANKQLTELIDLVKRIVTFGRPSNLFMDALRAEQERDGVLEGAVSLLIQAVRTRWNSTFYMLVRFVELSPYIARVLANPNLKQAPRMLSGYEVEVVTEIVQILKPFEQATKEISGNEYLTGCLVLPMISCVDAALNGLKPTNEVTTALQKRLQKSMGTRCRAPPKNPLLCHASLVDPRFKKLYMQPTIAAQAISEMSSEVKKVQKENGASSPPSHAVQHDDESLCSVHDKALQRGNSSGAPDESSFPSELRLYLQQPVLPRTVDAIRFWGQSKGLMAALSSVAIKYLTVIGSSVPSERLVSTLNDVVSDDRSRLTNKHITERVFMNRVDAYWVNM